MRWVVFAYSEVGAACLAELLAARAPVVGLFTHDDPPPAEAWFASCADLARRAGIPVWTPRAVRTGALARSVRALAPDLLLSFYYRRLLPPDVLAAARLGGVNLHGSLLPRYRGRCPINWQLLYGETRSGVTLHRMVEAADAGPILAQREFPLDPRETVRTFHAKTAVAARALVRELAPRLLAGDLTGVPQDETQATVFGGRTPADGRIDWARSAVEIDRLVRAVTHPYPGAFAAWRGRRLFVWAGEPTRPPGPARDLPPGSVLGTDETGLIVATGPGANGVPGAFRILRCALEGEPEEIDGAEFALEQALGPGGFLQ